MLFSIQHRDDIMTCFDNVGLRGVMQAHREEIFELSVSTPALLSDIDSPGDYRRELSSFGEHTQDT